MPQPQSDGSRWVDGRRDAFMLEKYLAKSLQQQQQQGDASEDVGGGLKNIQSLKPSLLVDPTSSTFNYLKAIEAYLVKVR